MSAGLIIIYALITLLLFTAGAILLKKLRKSKKSETNNHRKFNDINRYDYFADY